MVTLEEFIRDEINDYTKGVILSVIREGREIERHEDELIFNRFSLAFLFEENEVVIYDDILPEDAPLKMDMDSFLNYITAAD